jgi:hypothetical protein
MRNGGWFQESHRHSLAARGIKTSPYFARKWMRGGHFQEKERVPDALVGVPIPVTKVVPLGVGIVPPRSSIAYRGYLQRESERLAALNREREQGLLEVLPGLKEIQGAGVVQFESDAPLKEEYVSSSGDVMEPYDVGKFENEQEASWLVDRLERAGLDAKQVLVEEEGGDFWHVTVGVKRGHVDGSEDFVMLSENLRWLGSEGQMSDDVRKVFP